MGGPMLLPAMSQLANSAPNLAAQSDPLPRFAFKQAIDYLFVAEREEHLISDCDSGNHASISLAVTLCRIPAEGRFLSCEPLLGSLQRLGLSRIDRVIVGGEYGPGARLVR